MDFHPGWYPSWVLWVSSEAVTRSFSFEERNGVSSAPCFFCNMEAQYTKFKSHFQAVSMIIVSPSNFNIYLCMKL